MPSSSNISTLIINYNIILKQITIVVTLLKVNLYMKISLSLMYYNISSGILLYNLILILDSEWRFYNDVAFLYFSVNNFKTRRGRIGRGERVCMLMIEN